MTDDPTRPAPPPDSSQDPELIAYEQLSEGIDPAAIQDPEIRAMLTDRSKDLADIMKGESAEQVVDGRRFVHVLSKSTGEVGWLPWEKYEERSGAYVRADQDQSARLEVAQAIVNRTAGDVQEQLATLGGLETFAVTPIPTQRSPVTSTRPSPRASSEVQRWGVSQQAQRAPLRPSEPRRSPLACSAMERRTCLAVAVRCRTSSPPEPPPQA